VGVELANGMDDSSLFVEMILQHLLISEILFERKTLMENTKRLHVQERKHRTNRKLFTKKFEKVTLWRDQLVILTDHLASLDICSYFSFSNSRLGVVQFKINTCSWL